MKTPQGKMVPDDGVQRGELDSFRRVNPSSNESDRLTNSIGRLTSVVAAEKKKRTRRIVTIANVGEPIDRRPWGTVHCRIQTLMNSAKNQSSHGTKDERHPV
jgi:hypothetical protein